MPADNDEYMSLPELLSTLDPATHPVTCPGSYRPAAAADQAPADNVHSMYQLGNCPECGAPYPVLEDGTVRTHPRGISWTKLGD